jgi:hypothetical protein
LIRFELERTSDQDVAQLRPGNVGLALLVHQFGEYPTQQQRGRRDRSAVRPVIPDRGLLGEEDPSSAQPCLRLDVLGWIQPATLAHIRVRGQANRARTPGPQVVQTQVAPSFKQRAKGREQRRQPRLGPTDCRQAARGAPGSLEGPLDAVGQACRRAHLDEDLDAVLCRRPHGVGEAHRPRQMVEPMLVRKRLDSATGKRGIKGRAGRARFEPREVGAKVLARRRHQRRVGRAGNGELATADALGAQSDQRIAHRRAGP